MNQSNQLMIGAIAMGFLVAAVYFLRFWRDTRDRLFGLFALSFFVLAINRIAMSVAEPTMIHRDYFYWIRFVAFAVILLAILDKNRSRSNDGP